MGKLQTKKKGKWLEVTIPKEWDGCTIDFVLKEKWQVPKGLSHQYRMEKGIKINGENYPWSTELHLNDRFQILMFPHEEFGVAPDYKEIEILYEDDHLLIANKPAGMDTHPTNEDQTGTLANAIAYHFLISGVETKVRQVHRLDKDTTGTVIFAKHALAGAIMDRLLEKRSIKRTYLAFVHGRVKTKKGTINAAIGRDRHHPTRRRVSPTGQEAITHYEVINYFKGENMTLVKLHLQTGRTHQIRVHMAYIGHSLVGDKLYGIENSNELDKMFSRQALHAVEISFPHPITSEQIKVVAPFIDNPPIFVRFLT